MLRSLQTPSALGWAFGVLVLFAFPSATLAQPFQPVGSEFRVNSHVPENQIRPDVAQLSDGSTITVWVSYDNREEGADIYGQRYNSSGDPIGGEFRITSSPSGDQYSPSVAALSGGGFVVAWRNYRRVCNWGWCSTYIDIYYQRFSSSGSRVGSQGLANNYTSGSQYEPDVAALTNGGFVIVWRSPAYDGGSGYNIYGRRFYSNGSPNGGEFRVDSNGSGYHLKPSVAGLNDGGFVVTWETSQSGYDVYGQRFNSGGARAGSQFRVNSTQTYNQYAPSVTALSGGGFVIAWHGYGYDYNGVYMRRYSGSGSPMGGESKVGNGSYPAVAGRSDGGFIVTWGLGSIYGRGFDASGEPRGEDFRIASGRHPAVAPTSGGGFFPVWYNYDGNSNGIFGRRYAPATPLTFQVDGTYLALEPNEVLGLRGDTAPLSWNQSLVLSDDDGDDVWTGTAYFLNTLAGSPVDYKFVRHMSWQAGLSAADLTLLDGFEGDVGSGSDGSRKVSALPSSATTLPVVTYDNFVPVACDLPRIDDQVFDGQARTITITFADADGLAQIDFTDPDGNDYLNNLVVTASAGFTSSDGIRWTAPSPAPEEAVFVLSQDDTSIPTASYFAVLTDACQWPEAQVTVIDPVFEMGTVPGAFALGASYPNPFRAGAGAAVVPFEVPEASAVRVVAYDVLGREVAVLVDGQVEAGRHEARLDGAQLAPGTYVVRMTAGDFAETRRLTIVR